MFDVLTTRAGLTATTALVAVGLIAVLPETREMLSPKADLGGSDLTAVTEFAAGRVVVDENEETDRRMPASQAAMEDFRQAQEAQAGARQERAQEPETAPTERIDQTFRASGGSTAGTPQSSSDSSVPVPNTVEQRERQLGGPIGGDGRNFALADRDDAIVMEEPAIEAEIAEESFAPQVRRGISPGVAGNMSQQELSRLNEQADIALAAPAPAQSAKRIAPADPPVVAPESDTEAFANAAANDIKVVTEDPVSTFSIDVDTAAYAVVRSSLMAGQLPPREAVRVEEIVNYFNYSYAAPEGPHPFEPTVTVVATPWNAGTNLVHIGIQGTLPAIEDRPPLNLVFLIDTSGSMQDANKLPLLKQSFRLMLSELRPEDEVSIVTYAGSAGQVLEPTPAGERSKIEAALNNLHAGGSTAGQAGLQQAYQVAESMAADGEVTRVILATDGDFNVGLSDPNALKDFIADKRDSGTYLSVLGFGRGNLDDATMQALAQNGNGTAAYIDTLSEARKVLVDQLTGALFPIANDVKIQVEFNPSQIAEYRLIGYETRALNREDFSNDRVDAGDIGAGHRVTTIYEITPVGSDAIRNGPLRYSEAEVADASDVSDELGFFKLRYKRPGESTSTLIEQPILPGQGAESTDVRFSVAIAGFGQLLRGGAYLGNWGWQDAIDLANGARGEDTFGYRSEAVTLMRLAETLSR